MAEIRINATGGVKLYDADDSHYAQIVAGTITSNTDVMTLGHAAVVMGTKLDMNGSNLVLDADADTYLDTGTDDTIKFYVSGAHDLTISANAINVLSGTTLTIDSGATIANSGTATGFSSADPSSADGDTLGTASAEWSDLYLADSSVIYFGNDQDTTLTHTDGTGLTLNSTNKLCFNDASQFIQGSSNAILALGATDEIDLTATAIDLNGTLDVSGIATFADGAADAPSIANTGDANTGMWFPAADTIAFSVEGTEHMRLGSGFDLTIAKTANDRGTAGLTLYNNFGIASTVTGGTLFWANRLSDDGDLIDLQQADTKEGSISVSGGTVSYNAFCGSHWSRLADNSKPTILRGTVLESIATMMDWYQAEFDIGGGKIRKESIALDGRAVGDTIIHTWSESQEDPKETFTATIIKEDNERLPMCKISNTEDSKAVYGVFMTWDDADDGQDGDVNDMLVAALGAFVVRVHSGETVAIGDYLQSKGDGTAKVQADDILRANTIAKVTSTTKTITHGDGSYCVPCTLHCG